MQITLLDLTVREVIDQHPETLQVFTDNELGMFANAEILSSFGAAVRLRTVLKATNINAEKFSRLLGVAISEALNPVNSQYSDIHVQRPLNLFALLPCPLKVPLEEAFNGFLATLADDQRSNLSFCIEGNANSQFEYADYADHFESLDDMPDIIITPGFNSFFYPHFVERFIKTGRFACVNTYLGDRHLSAMKIIDPDGHYSMLAMNLLVLVVDHTRLGNRTMPKEWADLLKPEYAKSIAIRGNRDGTFCETLLLSLNRDFGRSGLSRFGRNVAWGWHPSQMVKSAGSGRENTPAISVMPLFFANNIKNNQNVSIVWPKDGALVSPVSMLVKADKRKELKCLVDFLIGPEVAKICAGAAFPCVHQEVDNCLPDRATFKWIGWDYIKNNNLKDLIADSNAVFQEAFLGESL